MVEAMIILKIKGLPLVKKFISFSFGGWIALVVGLISTPVTTRLFSPDQLGKASMFILAVNVIMIFLIFGTDQAYVRFYYEENEKKRNVLLRNSILFPIITFTLLSPFLFIFQAQISQYLFEGEVSYTGLLLSAGILLMLFQRFGVLVIRMKQEGKLFSYIQIAMKVLTLFFTVLFFLKNGDYFNTIIWAQLSMLIIIVFTAIWFGRDQWRFDFKGHETVHSIIDIFRFSTPLVFTTLVMWVFQSFDRIAIKQFSDFTELGIYVAAFRVVVVLNVIQSSFTTFWSPVAFEQYEKDSGNIWFYERMYIIVAVSMLLIGAVSIMGKDIIILLVGEKYRQASQIMPFLIFMPVMYTISETTVVGISFYKKTKWSLFISIVICSVNIAGNYVLVPKYGGKGAAISTGISYILFLILRTLISLRYYKVNYHLPRLFFSIMILVVYAAYSTLFSWNWINVILGLVTIGFIIITYIPLLYKIKKTMLL